MNDVRSAVDMDKYNTIHSDCITGHQPVLSSSNCYLFAADAQRLKTNLGQYLVESFVSFLFGKCLLRLLFIRSTAYTLHIPYVFQLRLYYRSVVHNVRPAGHIRPATSPRVARGGQPEKRLF